MSLETMSHDQAVTSYAAERYVLGELTATERDAFEGHYFDCAACFEEIKTGAQFLAHAREELDPEQEKGRLASMLGDLRRPAPVFVSAMLLGAVGICTYQQVQIANAKKPRLELEAAFVVANDAKGSAKSISVSRKARLSLSVDFKPEAEFMGYRAQIVADAGQVEMTLPVSPSQPVSDRITIGFPASTLAPGTHSVVIQGLNGQDQATEMSHGTFDLHFVD